jgi:hypothetical protein
LAILNCPGCGRSGLRIPDGRRGKVTCPRCGAEWFYPETIELREVEFRCSQTGARFIVQLTRRSPLHKFIVQGIKNAPSRPGQPVKEERSAAPKSTDAIENRNAPLDRLTSPNSGRWLARVFGKAGIPATSSPVSVAERATTTPKSNPVSYDANEYNWASFFCPYCNASSFIKCGAGHLVCDSTAEIRNGRRFHQCFCGNAGFIEGTIKTFEANQRTIEQSDVAHPNSTSAPPVQAASAPVLSPSAKKSERRSLP